MKLEQWHQVIDRNDEKYTDKVIKNIAMYFNCSPGFIEENEREFSLTSGFVWLAKHVWGDSNFIIDSRIHMLMPGWYPCIPGWHVDNAPRSGEYNQPHQCDTPLDSEHLMMVIGQSALPVFLLPGSVVDVASAKGKEKVYMHLNEKIDQSGINTRTINSGDVVHFNGASFHKGMPSDKHCWRFFIRASRNTDRVPTNEIRHQVQTYIPLNEGW